MAHFAQINTDNVVVSVIVVKNEDILDDGLESELKGVEFCKNILGGNWIQTSYNNNFRKNFAGVGYTYDAARDAFIPPKPFPSWTLNEENATWVPPSPRPEDPFTPCVWSEDIQNWIII